MPLCADCEKIETGRRGAPGPGALKEMSHSKQHWNGCCHHDELHLSGLRGQVGVRKRQARQRCRVEPRLGHGQAHPHRRAAARPADRAH